MTAGGRAAGSTSRYCGPTPRPSGTSTRRRPATTRSARTRARPSSAADTREECRGSPARGYCGPGNTPRNRERCPRRRYGGCAGRRDRPRDRPCPVTMQTWVGGLWHYWRAPQVASPMSRILGLVCLMLLTLIASAALGARQTAAKQLVAHRGASAYAPEHTLEAYQLAIEQKA